ncbi:MAG: hypothetical protein DMG93_11115 [Acidobacteria bacterium]|nr:MAG: hypothetical protein DMG93_11115 [Acidobacteriota bacterium]
MAKFEMRTIALLLALLMFTIPALGSERPGGFTMIGPGGGGAMFHPTVSPHDPNTALVACDMTGAYITHDGGRSWRMFNLRDVVHFFAFDPTDPKTIYAGTRNLWRSNDAGETWKLVYPKPSTIQAIRMNSDHSDETVIANPDPLGTIQAFAIDPADSRTFYAATAKDQKFALFISRDSGNSWQQTDTLPEQAQHIWVDPNSPRESRTLYAAGQHYVVVKNASGAQNRSTPFELLDVSMGFGDQKKAVIYCVSKQGIFVSTDSASSWQKAEFPGNGSQFRAIATSLRHPETAYVSYKDMSEGMQLLNALRRHKQTWFGVAKTSDAGKTWQLVWKESSTPAANVHDAWISERFGPGWAENPLDMGVADQNPNLAYGTDFGRNMQTTDGGANWTALYSRRVPGAEWTSTGLDVTTNYGVFWDPFDSKREFIAYTDIGLFRSEDGGKSWRSSTAGVPKDWLNTTYWMVFDPKMRGRVWSVNSWTHDLPRPKMWRKRATLDYRGGVCRSDDGGKTWIKSNNGMDETAPTHMLLDESSPVDARVLYVAAMGKGVYKSADGGKTWALKNNGITQSQPFAWRLAMDSSKTLYLVVARRSEDGNIGNDGDGALYRSRNGAESWEKMTLPAGVNGPNGLAIDPGSSNRLYLAAWARAAGMHGDGGGIFVSNDGGKTWRQALDRDRHVYDITIDPRNSKILYASGFESSAWRSVDRGEHWTRIPGFNFKWGHRVIPDPADASSIYVTTFGGSVWHGSVNGKSGTLDIATPELQPGR